MANKSTPPSPPVRKEPSTWEHYELWKRVWEAMRSLPDHFKTSTSIEGMLATDIFTLNAALGATIEEQVVYSLNTLRPVWDPNKRYQTYAFQRQPQTFPDVVLRKKTNGQDILMGIELKGWYLLAKEAMPNFRFVVTASCCNPWDLIVVVPWVLSNVLSGAPVVHDVFIEIAKYAAEQRNYYWRYRRHATTDTTIKPGTHIEPYPLKKHQISDIAVADSGGNFGRLARYGVMGDYVERMMSTAVRGVLGRQWLDFFKKHARPEEVASQKSPATR